MSKERELLKRWFNDIGIIQADIKLLRDTQALLTKPEQKPEQEPVAWMNDSGGCFLSDGNKYSENWTALYTEPPKRTPLSNEEIDKGLNGKNGFENWYDDRFVDGVRFAEKHHGIGGGE